MPVPPTEFVAMLLAAKNGDTVVADRLFSIIYDELHRLATGLMRRERKEHTLQPTALIHEAYLRLMILPSLEADDSIQGMEQFLAIAARVMRQVLVNHARARNCEKRFGNRSRNTLHEPVTLDTSALDILALEEALHELKLLDPIQHQLVEMRTYGDMTMEQCAHVLQLSLRSTYLEWSHAKAWLKNRLEAKDDGS